MNSITYQTETHGIAVGGLKNLIAQLAKHNRLGLLPEDEALVFGILRHCVAVGQSSIAERVRDGQDVSHFIIPSDGPTPTKEPPPSPI